MTISHFPYDEDKIFIIPEFNKPVKIITDELPCPIYFCLGLTFRCSEAKWKNTEEDFIIYCENSKNCKRKIGVYTIN